MDAKARTIKLPINLVRTQRKVARAENALSLKLDRAPTDEEIAKEAEITVDDLLALRDAARTVTSLDRPLGEGEDAAFGDLLPSDGPAPEDVVHVSLREETLQARARGAARPRAHGRRDALRHRRRRADPAARDRPPARHHAGAGAPDRVQGARPARPDARARGAAPGRLREPRRSRRRRLGLGSQRPSSPTVPVTGFASRRVAVARVGEGHAHLGALAGASR